MKIIPLGGLNEIGKNMTVIEYGDEIVVIDCGLAFPDDELLGVDLVIPDITYLRRNADKIKAFVITHAHEDHIGAIPYVFKEISAPIYCTKLAAGIIDTKLVEHKMQNKVKLKRVNIGSRFKIGSFEIEFIRTNHSIPDSAAIAINTPVGMIVHTGDFKIDTTPVSGDMIDLPRLGEIGKKGVMLLMSDSTNAQRPGMSMSERIVGEGLDTQFKNCDKRIIVATFASNIYRVQQILEKADKYGRKVALSGRSMVNTFEVAVKLGYIKIPSPNVLIDLNETNKYPREKLVIITTGSQGETMSALNRMAFSEHKQIEVGPGDKVLIAATPIPGNEKPVYKMINELFKKGAEVVYEKMAEMHVSGHACQEELKIMLAMIKPKYFMPVHGEHRHLMVHGELAKKVGVTPKHVFIGDIGKPLEITKTNARFTGAVPAGKVLVDGLGVGDVGTAVLRDRKHLSQDGLIIVVVTIDGTTHEVISGPDIISRGFIYVRDAEALMAELKKTATKSLDKCKKTKMKEWNGMKNIIKNDLSDYLYKKTKRNPMILPIITEV